MTSRRGFLKNASYLGIAATGLLSGCSTGKKAVELAEKNYQVYLKRQRFPQLKISMDRVIKETVGLRPFRTLGPRVHKEELGNKCLIHNYGHGGSGWSLSWGSSQRALSLAQTSGTKQFGVLGCGVMGLTTATLLLQKGYEVTIYTKDLPPTVTSSKATGTWSPSHYLIDNEHVDDEFVARWKEDCLFSYRKFQDLLGLNKIVK